MDKPFKAPTKVDELRTALEKKRPHADSEPAEAPPPAAGDDLSAQIHAAEEEAKTHYDKLLRVMAEFENFKRRIAKETEDRVRFANEKILIALLPILDGLDRLLEHVADDAPPEVKTIADGAALVQKELLAALEKCEVREVEALGKPFDPAQHEAIATIDSDDEHHAETVLAVHRRGWRLGERLLRPALVTVAKKSGGA